ncbi:hypothetical protein BE15_14925 [Sorangium cellulosum]|uniref:Uncharacterized protein n=1 Tax=Sorangium cellulosum TaxID=56 RepID=A0A150QBD3_SORCE|nr:hypothetical protein BE15_14925 [Sorangium cellulosum]
MRAEAPATIVAGVIAPRPRPLFAAISREFLEPRAGVCQAAGRAARRARALADARASRRAALVSARGAPRALHAKLA